MWGGVPLVVNETKTPKFDYVRATQADVYQLCKADLEFAVKWMPYVNTQTGGRAPREAAFHLLSEINICLKDYTGSHSCSRFCNQRSQLHVDDCSFWKMDDF